MCITLVDLLGCMTSKKTIDREMAIVEGVRPFDAIIVPGIPFKNGSWDTVMKARVIWAWLLYQDGYTKNIIFSGASVYSPYYESKVMGLYARKLGIPKEHIFYETKARHSTENVYYSYLLAKKLGFKSLALTTDPLQSFLLRSFTRKRFGTKIYHMPFVTDSIKQYNYLNPEIDPTPARSDDFVSITDKENFWRRLKGTLGRDIKWSQYKNGKLGPL